MFTRPIEDTILATGALGANSSRSEATPASDSASASAAPGSSAQRGRAPSPGPSPPSAAPAADDEDEPLLQPTVRRRAARAQMIATRARRAGATRRRDTGD